MNNAFLYLFLIFIGFVIGVSTGIVISRFLTEKLQRDFLKRMEIVGERNNEILTDLKQVISFNNKLATENREFEERLRKFITEWT